MKNVYKTNTRDFEFLLWEQFKIQEHLLSSKLYINNSQQQLTQLVLKAKEFAYEKLGPFYQSSDQESCSWVNATSVRIPSIFYEIWKEYKKEWSSLLIQDDIPMIVKRMVIEMFMGANPAFMTYSGFGPAAASLLELFGTQSQIDRFVQPLKQANYSACFCLTETQAGSDISAIKATATHIEGDKYHIKAEKIFISAGMHDLHDNIIYFVVAKTKPTESTYGLSCFIVPKYRTNADGLDKLPNGVQCINLVDKMGFKGCVNATLQFGIQEECIGYLLGGQENIALKQIIHLMHEARISTGLFALGMSSSAYLNSLEYAKQRVQGRNYVQSFNANAPRVAIINHPDVKKMLLEMKGKTEGFRALLAKLALHESIIKNEEKNSNPANKIALQRSYNLIHLLNPIIKAHFSEEAWKITELAIQVVGGIGYLSQHPFEQYARDVKVLSIWEGTNYIQSQSLVREKLNSGTNPYLFEEYQKEMNEILAKIPSDTLREDILLIQNSYQILKSVLKQFREWMRSNQFSQISAYSTLFLKMMAECTISTLHLEAMHISLEALSRNSSQSNDIAFYQEKIESSKYYIWHTLPLHQSYADIIKLNKVNFNG